MKLLKALILPHPSIIILFLPISVAALIASFTVFGSESVISYICYVLSAYELTVICVRIPNIIRAIKKFKSQNKYADRLSADVALRTRLSLYGTVIFNSVYALLQLGMGIYYRSFWFFSLAAYYILLDIMRLALLSHIREASPGEKLHTELCRYRICGIALTVMNLALAGMVVFIVYFNRGYEYHYIVTIAMAAYTFTSFTLSIINVIRYRKHGSPLLSATKAISLVAALVSMLSLETAMLTAFGTQESIGFRRLMTGLTGGAICAVVLAMGIYMIINANKKIKNYIKDNKNG